MAVTRHPRQYGIHTLHSREWATNDDDCVLVTFTLSHFMHVCKLVENIGSLSHSIRAVGWSGGFFLTTRML